MGRVLTNNESLQYAFETSKDVLPGSPSWKLTEPNTINSFGASISTTPRSPISPNRQRRKGTTTDLDSGLEYEADLTVDSNVDMLENFLFASATNADLTFQGNDISSSGLVTASLTAAQAGKLLFTASGPTSLLYSRGYVNAANNGIKVVTVDPVTTDVVIEFASTVVETAPTNAEVSIAGVRCAEIGDLAMTVSSGVGTLTSGNGVPTNQVDFTTLGLTVGQFIHIGGHTGSTQPFSAASVNTYGYARIVTIAAATLTLDKLEQANADTGHPALVAFDGTDDNAGGTKIVVDILFGRFVRNVPVNDSDFLERYTQFELGSPNLFETTPPTPVAQPDGYEYAKGNLVSTVQWNLPLTDKATITFGFVGTDTESPVDGASRKTNAATPIDPLFTEAFNTSADFARLRMADVDETGLTTDFKNLTVSFSNNVSGEKVLGLLGSRFINYGNFEVDIEGNALFTEPLVINRIRDNTTVSFDMILENDDGAIAVDVPSATIGNGARELPVNESVQIALTLSAFLDPTLNTSIGVSLFPVTPASAA